MAPQKLLETRDEVENHNKKIEESYQGLKENIQNEEFGGKKAYKKRKRVRTNKKK